MSTNSTQPSDDLPLELTRQIDLLCDEFESTLASHGNLNFQAIVARIDIVGRKLLIEELCLLAADFLRAAGDKNIADTILAANGELAEELRSVLKNLETEQTQSYPAPLMSQSTRDYVANERPRRKQPRGLHIRCPHCSHAVELTADTSYDVVNCQSCGSNFSLVDRSEASKTAATLKKMGRFELIGRLGMGGFGTVWKARDTELDRIVAVKIPRFGHLSAQETELFFREARAAAQLRHPNIVPVHEVGCEEDTVFIVSDLIQGVTLSDWLKTRRLTAREAAALMIDVTDALEHAHKSGVIHRDLKPSNIMIDAEGQPHIMDFGLAKRDAEEITMTVDGQILGTPAYMSPEQAGGNSQWVDCRSDVYSLGVMFFELLTVELPFRGNAQAQLQQRLSDDAPSARSINRHIPRDLETISAKCLERDPARRYETAKAVGDELRCFLNNVPIQARPLSKPARALRWTQRNPLLATVAGLVLVLAIGGPTAALAIAGQRDRLKELVAEKSNIIGSFQKNIDSYVNQQSILQKEVDVQSGKLSPWQMWPAKRELLPRQKLFEGFYTHSAKALSESLDNQKLTGLDEVRALLALAKMEEFTDREAESAQHLTAAVGKLKQLEQEFGMERLDEPLAQLQIDCTKATRLPKPAENELFENARARRQHLAETEPTKVEQQIAWFESEILSAISTGKGEHLTKSKEIKDSLASHWPNDAAGAYRIACFLAATGCLLEANATSTELKK